MANASRFALLTLTLLLLASCSGNDNDPKTDTDQDVSSETSSSDGGADAQSDDSQTADAATDAGGIEQDTASPKEVLTPRSLRFTDNFTSLWGSGPDNIWWVGSKGRVLHYNGSVLLPRDAGTDKDLYSVWGRGPKDVWVAGDGVVLHYNGNQWIDRTPAEFKSVVFRAVHAPIDNSTLLIGGDDGIILRVLESGKIVKENTNSALKIRSIRAIGIGNVWAVGDKGQALRLSGGTWSSVPLPKANEDLHGLANSPDGRLYTVGIDGFVAATENKVWEATLTNDPKSRDLFGVWAVSEKEAWAVGKDGALIHHIGTKWNLRDIDGTYMKTKTFRAVWGQAKEPLYAYAIGDGGAGIRYDSINDKWLDFRAETTAHLNAATALSDGRIVVPGDGGVLLQAKDATSDFVDLGVAVTGTNLRDACDDGKGGFWAVGDAALTVHVDASGTPTIHLLEAVAGQRLTGATLVDGQVIAVGHGGVAVRKTADGWQSESTGAQFNLNAVASHKDEAWAVGEFGTIVHRKADGSWVKEASGESFNLHRIVVWDDGAVAVGDNGLVLLRSEGKWTKVFESPGLFLYGVTRRTDGKVIAVGWKGTLVVGQGDTWSAVDSGLPNVLLDIAATGSDAVVVGHKGGIYQLGEDIK